MKRIATVISGVSLIFSSFIFALPLSVSAATFTLGNDSSSRSIVDTYSNFTIIDTNHSASLDGQITSFDYYASNLNPFRFVLVDSANKVLWISDEIIPGTANAANHFTLVAPVPVHVGDNVGMYFAQTGTIPFEYVGSPASYTPNNNGLPVVGSTLSQEGISGRTYSLVANGDTTNCSTLTLVSSTATQFEKLTTNSPASSDDTLFTLGSAGSAVLTGPDGFTGAWDSASNDPDVSGAIWVNNNSVAPSTPAGGDPGQGGNQDVWRLFSHSFSIPSGAVINSAVLHFTADNSVTAYLDEVSVGTASSYLVVSDANLTLGSGSHELEFVVKNDAYNGATNPTGVIYKAVIDYCVPPVELSCPAAPSIAAKYLKSLGIKPGSSTEKNIISLVAKEMGPQKNFKGSGACENPTYTDLIKAFVNSKLPS